MARVGLPVERLSDEALLAGLTTGAPDVALAFVRRFQSHVFAVALAIVGDRMLAEDVAQQTFERVWRRGTTYEATRGTVRSWLTVVTRNIALDSVKRRRPEPIDPADLVRLLAPAGDGPEGASMRDQSREQLRDALRQIPAEQARALVMAGVYRMTAEEVAAAEQIPLGTAKTRIRSAMAKVRHLLPSPEVHR
ncbi:MAG TPA: sigma-70 family RNA polymerase sigma factor [Acidimicrobiales bacterium]|nr:sigma-70 family RNA polymerase sigma factor [Acidimicrobiales bacterium]